MHQINEGENVERTHSRALQHKAIRKKKCAMWMLLQKYESEYKPMKYERNGLQKQSEEKKKKKLLCVEEERKREKIRQKKTIWKSNLNSKSFQVNEVEWILRLAKLRAPRNWNVNTCSFYLLHSSPSVFMIFFLHLIVWCVLVSFFLSCSIAETFRIYLRPQSLNANYEKRTETKK